MCGGFIVCFCVVLIFSGVFLGLCWCGGLVLCRLGWLLVCWWLFVLLLVVFCWWCVFILVLVVLVGCVWVVCEKCVFVDCCGVCYCFRCCVVVVCCLLVCRSGVVFVVWRDIWLVFRWCFCVLNGGILLGWCCWLCLCLDCLVWVVV